MHFIKKLYTIRNNDLILIPLKKYSNNYSKITELLPTREQLRLEMQLKSDAARAKFNDVFKWYEQFTGLSEVRIAQQKVLDAQDQFTTVQNKRREVYNLLSEVQLKRKDIHDKLQLSKPGEPRYLKLIMEDHEIIGQENKLKESFIDVEKLERELFTNLTTAVRISHERERLQADKTKYWSIIGSIIGTIIGIIGSSINNSHKLKEIKVMLKEIAAITQVTSDTSVDKLSKIENIVKTTFKENIAKPVMKTFGSQTSFNDSFKSNEQDLKLDRTHMHMIAIAGILTLLMCSCCR